MALNNRYTRYIKYFNNLKSIKKQIQHNDIIYEEHKYYDKRKYETNIHSTKYYNSIYYTIKPKIINRNDVYKLNGYMNWLNTKEKTDIYNVQIKKKNIKLINPNVYNVNKYIDKRLINNYNLEVSEVNIKYGDEIIKMLDKFNDTNKVDINSLKITPKYKEKDLINIQNTLINNYFLGRLAKLKYYGFTYPIKNKDFVNNIYYTNFKDIITEKDIDKLVSYLYKWNEKASRNDFLDINIKYMDPVIINIFYNKLDNIYRLNYDYKININNN